ncbi:MAG: PAS domain-containing sensor histidine kinase [Hyphomicrobiales bacterium]|nr:PAS domain-containing sensor histidine kinase [Hyphomicrobiales bacterium]
MVAVTKEPGPGVHEIGPPIPHASGKTGNFGAATVILAVLSGFATFLILTGLTPISPTHEVVVTTLLVNGVLVLLLVGLITYQVVGLLRARLRGIAGARLHARIVGLFALVAALPAIIVAVVASVTLDRGLDRWFSGRTQLMIQNSASVAQAYLDEHARAMRADLIAMAHGAELAKPLFEQNKERFDELVTAEARLHGLSGAYIIKDDLTILTRFVDQEGDTYPVPPPYAIEGAREGETVILVPGPDDQATQVGGVTRLTNYDNAYLYLVRRLDPAVMQQVRDTAQAILSYRELEARRFGVQVAFGLMYVGVSLILLLSAIWIGFWFANKLVAPIRRLIGAAQLVSQGDLEVQVPFRRSEGELANLGRTFNDMTNQLRTQRGELLQANEMLDQRRRFTEAVLAGASAGVIGLSGEGTVDIVNRSAQTILKTKADGLLGRPLRQAMPEIAPLLDKAIRHRQRLVSGQIDLRRDGEERNITVRVTTEGTGQDERRYVVTLDDITELVSAQRTSAWADVARRIAHEIKNPLTPIQLSAERLKRKYAGTITQDREVFEQCTDTIIRQVGDIGRMVDEFSSFARMPKAVLAEVDIADAVRQAAFLIGVGRDDLKIGVDAPQGPIIGICDRRLLTQAVTNLVKNSAEALAAADMADGETPWIEVKLAATDDAITIAVTDNGCGFPKENRHRLLEPYMTTREKGTGLGLAIVRRIIEDHGGTVTLADAPQVAAGGHGAQVTLHFPRHGPAVADAGGADRATRPRGEPKQAEPAEAAAHESAPE